MALIHDPAGKWCLAARTAEPHAVKGGFRVGWESDSTGAPGEVKT